jgi:hypothetical protein
MVNTGFAHDNVIRLIKTDIDFAANVFVSDNFFIDIIFEENGNKKNNNNNNDISLEQIVKECKRKIEGKILK